MKRFRALLFTALFTSGCMSTATADGCEQPIPFDSLPQNAQAFCATHFKDLTPAYAVKDTKIQSVEYEVTYMDRTEVEFRADGLWKSVERRSAPVPAAIVPKPVADFVADDAYARHQFIRKIERNLYTWEIELSGGLEITFDSRFNVIDYDD